MEEASALCKTLTTLISHLQPQIAEPTFDKAASSDGRAYNHIATLLTRGNEHLEANHCNVDTVSGAKFVEATKITVITTIPPLLDNEPSGAYATASQNQQEHETFKKVIVGPNPKSLAEIATNLDREEKVSLETHASDVLRALIDSQGLDRSSEEYDAATARSLHVAIHRCFAKVKQCVLAVERLYTSPTCLVDLLRSWVPSGEERLDLSGVYKPPLLLPVPSEQTWVILPAAPAGYFDEVPKKTYKSSVYCEVNLQTAPKLLRVLAQLYEDVVTAVSNYNESDWRTIGAYALCLHYLTAWLNHLSGFLRVLLKMPSMETLLVSSRKRWTGDNGMLNAYEPARGEEEGTILIHYLDSIVAWNRAMPSLATSKILRSKLNLTLNIIQASAPPLHDKMYSISELMQRLAPDLESGEGYEMKEKMMKIALDSVPSPESTIFRGSVHSNALLMGLAMATRGDGRDSRVPPEVAELFQNINRNIGTGQQCCWMCELLRDKLHAEHGVYFHLLGTTGIISPWAPPFGLSLEELNEINGILMARLMGVLRNAAERSIK